jgi:hypothetical protein
MTQEGTRKSDSAIDPDPSPVSDARGTGVRDDHGVPPNLVLLGISVGLILACGGVAMIAFNKAPLLASLTTCVGFGLVLASFGSRAGGAWGGWSATGAGAMAIFLFLLLMHYTIPEFKKYGQIGGNLDKVVDLRIVDDHPLFEYRDPTTKSIQFVTLRNKFANQRLTVQVDTTEKEEGKVYFEMVGDGIAIAQKYLSNNDDTVIKWVFDYNKRVIKANNNIIFPKQMTKMRRPSYLNKRCCTRLVLISIS